MRIAIVTFDGFNEIDSFVSLNVLNRVALPDWKAEIVCPTDSVTSGNGVRIDAQRPLEHANDADAVLFGSGRRTAEMVADPAIMGRLRLDPTRQLVGSQCSGALALAELGLVAGRPVCSDNATRPLLEKAGMRVLGQTFHADGNIATAGGCLSSPVLASWVICRLAGRAVAEAALDYVAPVGEARGWIASVLAHVDSFVSKA